MDVIRNMYTTITLLKLHNTIATQVSNENKTMTA